MLIVGIDLAWGENRSDGVCFLRYRPAQREAWIEGYAYPHGDEALLAAVMGELPQAGPAFLAIDAPIVCPNAAGGRPVDRETSRLFCREHAGCHPANATRCPRPARVLQGLATRGFAPGWDFAAARAADGAKAGTPPRLAAEVYPHAALVRLLRLPRIVKYKKGPVAERRREFARLQQLLIGLLAAEFPFLDVGDAETCALFAAPWTKENEDKLDAFICALVGLWHVQHRGRRSEVLGDLATGFILLPEEGTTNGLPLQPAANPAG